MEKKETSDFLNSKGEHTFDLSSYHGDIYPTKERETPEISAEPPKRFKGDANPKERTIGQYRVGKTIGEGTFGKVKLGTHLLTNEKVSD